MKLVIDIAKNRRKRVLSCTAITLFFVIASGCSTSGPSDLAPIVETSTSEGISPSLIIQTPVSGNFGTSENPIVVGADYASTFYPEILSQWQEWARRLEEATGLKFAVQPRSATELELLEAMRTGEIHLASLSALAYVFAYDRGWVEPAANFVENWNGQDARGIMFIARVDSDFNPGSLSQVLKQLKGKRPCYRELYPEFPGLAPLDEYILPSGLLALHSISTSNPAFIGDKNGLASVEAGVFYKFCDFAAVDAISQEQFKNNLPRGISSFSKWSQDMQILFTTPPINPVGMIATSSILPRSIQAQIRQAVLSVPAIDTATTSFKIPNMPLYDEFKRIVDFSAVDIQEYLDLPIWTPEPALLANQQWIAAPQDILVADVPMQGGPPFLPYMNDQPLNRLVLPAIYAELVRIDAEGSYFPYLVENLPTLQNQLARFIGVGEDRQFEVEFRLRSNLTWQDGYPLTANDLVFSWNLVMDPAWPGSHYGQAGYAPEIFVSSVEALSPNRVVYRFMSQRELREVIQSGGRLGDLSLYAGLAQHLGPVVPLDYMDVGRNVFPEHLLRNIAIKDVSTSEFARRPIFAGSYRLIESGQPDKQIILETFENFTLGKPQIARVIFGASYYSEGVVSSSLLPPDLLAQALQTKAVQAQLGSPGVRLRQGEDVVAYDSLFARDLANVIWTPSTSWEVLDFNLDNSHLSDLRVRQAIAHAINRQMVINQVLAGHAGIMKSYLPAWHPFYAGDLILPGYAYDPGEARILLKKAGYDLSSFPATHPTRGPLILRLGSMDVNLYPRPPIAAIIKENLAQVGIQVDVQFYLWQDFEGQDCSAVRNGRNFDLGMAGWGGASVLFPVGWLEQATALENIPTSENGCPYEKSNWSGWRNSRAEAIRVQLADGNLALEYPDNYKQLWVEHQLLWATELPSLPLFNMERPVVIAPNLVGVLPSPLAFVGVEETWNIFEWELK